ncbi:MAG: pH regulation protein F [Calditrichaeota bacterium]|nr:MAG: pH regulation protein F [Calditrichota bacterium]
MEAFFIGVGIVLFGFMFVVMYRVIFGPRVMDRIVAINVIGTKTTVILVIIGVVVGKVGMFVDFALTYALLNFLASLAVAKFFQRHKTVDPEDPQLDQSEKAA